MFIYLYYAWIKAIFMAISEYITQAIQLTTSYKRHFKSTLDKNYKIHSGDTVLNTAQNKTVVYLH